MEGCLACDLTTGRLPLPGGIIRRFRGWIVEHCVGSLGVGTLIVKPERHVVHVADLSPTEASAMGEMIHRATAVVTELCRPEQVYVTLWSHAGGEPGHIHFVIQPVSVDSMKRHGAHGPKLQVAMLAEESVPDPDAVDEFAQMARELWRLRSTSESPAVLEQRLLDPRVRRDQNKVGPLLADSFAEFGASGRVFDKEAIVAALAGEEAQPIEIDGLETRELAPGVVQVTYRSRTETKVALRSSIWLQEDDGWKVVFHQGTPTA